MDDFDYSSPYLQQHAPPDWSTVAAPEPATSALVISGSALGGAERYPYDPRLRVEMQVGLDKLRCIPDRELAQTLFNFHKALEPKWQSPEARKWLEIESRKREDAELEHLLSLSERAFKGELSEPVKQLAEHILLAEATYGRRQRRTDLPSLREFDFEFKKLRKLRVAR